MFAVKSKMSDMGFHIAKPGSYVEGDVMSPPLDLSTDLPSIEEKLKVLNAALVALEKPGLSRNEVLRLRTVVQGVKIYNALFAEYLNYRGIEQELLDVRKMLAEENARHSKGVS